MIQNKKDIIEKVINQNNAAVVDYRRGEDNALNFLVGQVMEETNGKIDPDRADKMLREFLEDE